MKDIRIMGLKLNWFAVFLGITILAIILGIFPSGMGTGILFTLLLGSLLEWIGDNTPIVKDYLGGGSIVIIFGSAALVRFGIIPEGIVTNVKDLFGQMDFMNVALSMLITGSIMGTDRDVLRKASIRFIPAIIGAQVLSIIFVSIVSLISGQDIIDNILYVALPILSGGMSAGAVPLSQIYEGTLGISADQTISVMASSIAFANALAIIAAGLVSNFAKNRPSITGYGQMMPSSDSGEVVERHYQLQSYNQIAIGFVVAFSMLLIGTIISYFIPAVHTFAFMVIATILIKIFKLLPQDTEDSAVIYSHALMPIFKNVVLCGIGITLIDFSALINALTPIYFITILSITIGSFFGAALIGKVFGIYPIEAGISAGLCAADMGGSGDLAILGAGDRLALLPYAAVATRIGGAIILIVASLLTSIM